MNKLVHIMTIGVRPRRLQRFYRRHPVMTLAMMVFNGVVYNRFLNSAFNK